LSQHLFQTDCGIGFLSINEQEFSHGKVEPYSFIREEVLNTCLWIATTHLFGKRKNDAFPL
jgi:hypothetical protein